MSRPAQLEAQIVAANEIQAKMLEDSKPPVDPNESVTPPDTTVGTPPPDQVTPPIVIESPVTIQKDDFDKLEQRYRTLQGMHQADGQRYRNELASMQAAMTDLEDRLVAATTTKPVAPTPSRYVTPEDVAEYGDTLEMVRRAAKEEAEAVAAKQEAAYQERIAQLEQRVGSVVPTVEGITRAHQEQIKSDFWTAIGTQVPDWKTINDDMNFKAWLLAEDPVTGSTRQQFLSQARNEYNAPRVIKFFQEWKRSAAGGQTPAPTNTSQSELERLVSPGASKGGTVPTEPAKKQWTRDDILNFYKDVQIGKYADKQEEKKKIEADIYAAQLEKRISD